MSKKNSVLPDEMAFFNKLTDMWWDKNGPMRILLTTHHLTNRLMLKYLIAENIIDEKTYDKNLPLKGFKVLDAGCGGGLNAEPITRLGAEVTALDPNADMIRVAKAHASLDESLVNLKYINTSVEEYCVDHREEFDIVISYAVLEHLTDYELYLDAVAKALKPGGATFISTYNKTWLAKVIGIWAVEYIINIVPRGMHHYDMFISSDDVTKILKKHNIITRKVDGLFVNPITHTWYPILPSIFYFLHAVKK